MKILSKSDQSYIPNFTALIEDRGGFKQAIVHSDLSAVQKLKVAKALEAIKIVYPGDSIIFDRYSKKEGLNNYSIYFAKLKSTGIKIAESKDSGWCKFVVYLANVLRGVN